MVEMSEHTKIPVTTLDRNVLSIASLDDESDEKAYWLTRTPQERIHHMEYLRQLNYGDRARGPMQRVLEVVSLHQIDDD